MGIKESTGRDVFLYSTWHVGVASWLGGAVSGAILVGLNWLAVRRPLRGLGVVAAGVAFTGGLLWLASLDPEPATRGDYKLVWLQVGVMAYWAQMAGEKQRALVQPPDEVSASSIPRVALGVFVLPLVTAAVIVFAVMGKDQLMAFAEQMALVNRANSGNVEAQITMAERQFADKNYVAMLRWLDRPEAKASAKGLRMRGWMHEEGLGVTKDAARAAELYRQASEKGDGWAQNQLGWFCEDGIGVKKDLAEAARWYTKAAEQGEPRGQANLGKLMIDGLGGLPKDQRGAAALFEKAAAAGDALGETWLGWCHENGTVYPKDTAKALSWYRKAAAQGDKFAAERISALGAGGR